MKFVFVLFVAVSLNYSAQADNHPFHIIRVGEAVVQNCSFKDARFSAKARIILANLPLTALINIMDRRLDTSPGEVFDGEVAHAQMGEKCQQAVVADLRSQGLTGVSASSNSAAVSMELRAVREGQNRFGYFPLPSDFSSGR